MKYLFVVVLVFLSCTSNFQLIQTYNNISSTKIETIFIEGKEVVLSNGKETDIALYGEKTVNNEILFHIAFANASIDRNINFIPENIKVIGFDDNNNMKLLKVYSAEEYISKKKSQQAWAMAFMALGGAADAANAGKSTSYTKGSVYGSGGYASGYSTTTTYDNSKVEEAKARNRANLSRQAQLNALSNAATEQGLLKSNTVYPGYYIEGNVIVGYIVNYDKKYVINIPCGTDNHTITLIPKPIY